DGEEMADTALDALDDVSFLPSSLRIPSLLLGEKPDPGTWDLGGLRVLEDEDLGGRMCYRLRGSNSLGGQSTLWIDHENLMILRIDKTTEDDESRTESTIVCIPEFNPAPTEPERTFQVP